MHDIRELKPGDMVTWTSGGTQFSWAAPVHAKQFVHPEDGYIIVHSERLNGNETFWVPENAIISITENPLKQVSS